MPKLPVFEPNPREVALADLLGLDHDEVVAGSFTIGPEYGGKCTVIWRTAFDAYAAHDVPVEDLVGIQQLPTGPSEQFLRNLFRP